MYFASFFLPFHFYNLHNIRLPSYHVYIDENGDAAGNYTILNRQPLPRNMSDINGKEDYGLYPIGTFSAPKDKRLPVYYLLQLFSYIISLSIN